MAATVWHITFGTYGSRLHGGVRATVHHKRNQFQEPFLPPNVEIEQNASTRMRGEKIQLSREQQIYIESALVDICRRGGWDLQTCAAPIEGDHVHVLLKADEKVQSKQIMTWMKRWLSEKLNEQFERPKAGKWWAKGGSTKVVKDASYLSNVIAYIDRQRSTESAR